MKKFVSGRDTLQQYKNLYVKKPIQIKAIQIDEDFSVETLEGTMIGRPGDYLAEGVDGELYVIKNEIFLKTYEKVV